MSLGVAALKAFGAFGDVVAKDVGFNDAQISVFDGAMATAEGQVENQSPIATFLEFGVVAAVTATAVAAIGAEALTAATLTAVGEGATEGAALYIDQTIASSGLSGLFNYTSGRAIIAASAGALGGLLVSNDVENVVTSMTETTEGEIASPPTYSSALQGPAQKLSLASNSIAILNDPHTQIDNGVVSDSAGDSLLLSPGSAIIDNYSSGSVLYSENNAGNIVNDTLTKNPDGSYDTNVQVLSQGNVVSSIDTNWSSSSEPVSSDTETNTGISYVTAFSQDGSYTTNEYSGPNGSGILEQSYFEPDDGEYSMETFYDGHGNENIVQTYNVSIGQSPLDIQPSELPSGEYVINLKVENLVDQNLGNGIQGYIEDPSDDSVLDYISIQYGQGTANLIATSPTTGATSTLATVHDVATMLVNNQWEPVQGPIDLYFLSSNGFDIDTGPHILVDQSGGSTTDQSLSLSGNVTNALPGEEFNFANGDVVNISDNGVHVGSTTIQTNELGTNRYLGPDDTAWAATINLAPGDNAITITTTDANGLSGSASLDYVYNAPSTSGTGSTTTPSGGTGTASPTGSSGLPTPTGAALNPPASTAPVSMPSNASGATKTASTSNSTSTSESTGHQGAQSAAAEASAQGFISSTPLQGIQAATGHAAQAGIEFQAVTQNEDGTSTTALSSGDFFDNKDYYSLTQTRSSDGILLNTIKAKNDGSHGISVTAGDQTLTSLYDDAFFSNGAGGNTFVFDPGHGQDVIRNLQIGTGDDDLLSFSGTDFNNDIAQVLAHTFQTKAGNTITYDPMTGDAVKLVGITKQQLVQNQGDIAFHM